MIVSDLIYNNITYNTNYINRFCKILRVVKSMLNECDVLPCFSAVELQGS